MQVWISETRVQDCTSKQRHPPGLAHNHLRCETGGKAAQSASRTVTDCCWTSDLPRPGIAILYNTISTYILHMFRTPSKPI